ncbi:hypothetical protein NUM3379_13970 [Kineococcus sp. NUM-3379]
MDTAATTPRTRQARAGRARGAGAAAVATALAAGLAGGVLTSYAQGLLGDALAPLANSAGSWCLLAALVSLRARRPVLAALCGAVALLALNAGFGLGHELRGYTYSTRTFLFWSASAVTAGPVVGFCTWCLRRGRPLASALAAGVLAGILAGESASGLTLVAGTTPAGYWLVQLGLAAALLTVVSVRRLRAPAPVAAACAVTAATAAALWLVYAGDLLAWF